MTPGEGPFLAGIVNVPEGDASFCVFEHNLIECIKYG